MNVPSLKRTDSSTIAFDYPAERKYQRIDSLFRNLSISEQHEEIMCTFCGRVYVKLVLHTSTCYDCAKKINNRH